MPLRSVRRAWPVPILLALVFLTGAGLQDFGIHTDDGCRTEVHCRLCQTVHGRVAQVSVSAPVLPWMGAAEAVTLDLAAAVPSVRPRLSVSRGPPSSL